MQCPQCQHENDDGAQFCEECGTRLVRACPSCGHEARPTAKFCPACGTPLTEQSRVQTSQSPLSYTPKHLAERILAEQAAMEARGATDGERKTITALFADIKGSMELIEDLDPEEARQIIDPALKLMMEAVHRYKGYVAQSLGDGIFALFGAPIAHEDHAQRALYAALRMQEEAERYAEKLRLEKGLNLHIRVGVNTGKVVVRSIRKDDLHTDYVPIGHSTSLAARMESLAAPGTILVSEHTHKLTEGYFEFKSLGAAQVKGVSEPVNIYEVLGAGPLRTRLQVAARRGLVRFVGRESEMEQMRQVLEQAKAGHWQIVGVMGEPGVGKSRLFHEFRLVSQRGCLVLETFSVSHGKAYPYLPLIELLKEYFQITPQDDERKRREKVGGKVLMLDRTLEDTLPYLFTMLGISDPSSSLQQMDPQIRRRRTFEALKRLLLRESLNQPLLLIFEDLHWLDNETQAFLGVLSESVATARTLLLVNYRPEYRHEWGSKTYYTQLRLDSLGREEAQELLTALLGDGGGLKPLKQLILEKTEGNPFFIEEMVQALFEQGVLVRDLGVGARLASHFWSKSLTELQIPPTVQGVLAARIDRLGPEEKELLQTSAVVGKGFSLSLLKGVVNQPEEKLRRLLSHLQAGEFIYEQPAFPEVEYTFKHALTQEVAYNSLLMARRRVLHEHTAQAIEEVYGYGLEDHYSDLAHHYSCSGNTEKAVKYLHLAGEQAVQRSAHAEAISHLTTALELLKTLPDTPERAHQELLLQVALGVPLMATKGYAAPEVERVYARALELCRQVGATPQLFPVLWGLGAFYLVRAEYKTARELGEQLLSLAQSVQDPAPLAYWVLGEILFWLGEFAPARAHLEQSIALYDPRQHRSHAFLYGQDSGVACLIFAAHVLWHLGYPDQALKRIHEALTLAQELSHPFSLAWALSAAAWLHQCRREGRAAQARAEAAITLSTEQGFPFWVAWGTILRGWALAEQACLSGRQGQAEEGIAQIRQGMAAYRATGAELARPYQLAQLAETYGKVGQAEEGLSVLAEALAVVDKNRERQYEAELYRLYGELSLRSGEAETGRTGDSGRRTGEPERGRSGEEEKVPPFSPIPRFPDSPIHSHTPRFPVSSPEEAFQKAIDIARRQSAKSLELRAVTSLSRLWQEQGKREEARRMLTEIYGWFTEGFDTRDLQDAKALLQELEGGKARKPGGRKKGKPESRELQ